LEEPSAGDRMSKTSELLPRPVYLLTAGALAFMAILPLLNPGDFIINVAFMVCLYAYLSLCWNLPSGFAGQFSLGHALFYGLGAYSAGLLYMKFQLTPWLGMILGPLLAIGVALVIGYATFRLHFSYYSLAALAVAEVMRLVFLSWDYVGGAYGIWYAPIHSYSWIDFQFNSVRIPYNYITLVMLAGVLLLTWKIRHSDFGLRLMAIRDDEVGARSLGINPLTHKLLILAISAGLTAAGGVLYAQFTQYVEPNSTMSVWVTMDMILPAMMGGLGITYGPVIGSFILTPLSWATRVLLGDTLQIVLRGVILMLIVAFLPDGILKTVIDKYTRPKLIKR